MILNKLKMLTLKGLFIVIIFSLTLSSCLEMYNAEEASSVKTLVVDALITDDKENQTITLSRSTLTVAPVWDPVSGANIVVVDKGNNVFSFNESRVNPGIYEGNIPFEFLVPGNAFKLSFNFEGKDYESNFEDLLSCPNVDSVYYEINNEYFGNNNKLPERGIEFFLDVKANNDQSKHFKWILDETYEYHATWPIEKYWNARWHEKPANYSYFVCYKTEAVNSIYTATTVHLDENVYLKFPLHFVNNQTQRLYYRYSLLVKQLSMTPKAFDFWEALKKNNQSSGELFDSQPVNVKGNIVCLTKSDENILGYFGVSSVKTKRISIDEFRDLIYDYNVFCTQQFIDTKSLTFIIESPRYTWPIYVAPVPSGEPPGIYYANQECFDCRLAGGTLEAPEFWNK